MPTFSNYVTDFAYETESIRPTSTRGLEDHRLDFISVRNAHIFRTLHPLYVSSSLVGIEGGCDQIAGSKRVNAGGIQARAFSAGEW